MSCNGEAGPAPAGGWLEGDQRRAWLAYIRVQLRLAYEMNRQLLADSGMSLPDYDVLTALSVADGERMPITVLAAHIGWERSRLAHHARRMSARGLVTCGPSAADRRVTEVALTGRGRQALEEAAPRHVDLVRRLFFEGLPDRLVGPLRPALDLPPGEASGRVARKQPFRAGFRARARGGIFTAWMPVPARSASTDGELPVSAAEQEPGIRGAIRSWRYAALGDGGDLQHLEIRWIIDALTP